MAPFLKPCPTHRLSVQRQYRFAFRFGLMYLGLVSSLPIETISGLKRKRSRARTCELALVLVRSRLTHFQNSTESQIDSVIGGRRRLTRALRDGRERLKLRAENKCILGCFLSVTLRPKPRFKQHRHRETERERESEIKNNYKKTLSTGRGPRLGTRTSSRAAIPRFEEGHVRVCLNSRARTNWWDALIINGGNHSIGAKWSTIIWGGAEKGRGALSAPASPCRRAASLRTPAWPARTWRSSFFCRKDIGLSLAIYPECHLPH